MDKKTDFKKTLEKLEETLDLYLVKKAPFTLPQNIKELIVQFLPYLVIISLIAFLPSVLIFFGWGGYLSSYIGFWAPRFSIFYQLSVLILIITMILETIAIPGLFKKEKKAWRFLYYAGLIGLLGSLVRGDVVGALIGGLVGFYLLFQIKDYYTK